MELLTDTNIVLTSEQQGIDIIEYLKKQLKPETIIETYSISCPKGWYVYPKEALNKVSFTRNFFVTFQNSSGNITHKIILTARNEGGAFTYSLFINDINNI